MAGHRFDLSLAAALALAACAAPSPSPQATTAPPKLSAAQSITAEAVFAEISRLSADSLRGRDTPSPGLEAAAAYIVREFQAIGLEPAGENGTFYQRYPYPLRQVVWDRVSLHVIGPDNGPDREQMLQFGREFFTQGGTRAEFAAPLVYIGREFAPVADEAGVLRDRIAMAALPGEWSREFRLLRDRQAAAAEREGAVAIIHILDSSWTADRMAEFAAGSGRPVRMLGGDAGFPEFFVSYSAAQHIFAAAGLNLDAAWQRAMEGGVRATMLPGLTATAEIPRAELDRASPPNVVGMLRGGDPPLQDEYLILSAHMDHVGVGEAVNGDSIYNGADDNASGTVALLQIARAMAALPEPPRRSVIFLLVSGEEKGLLGSRWYSDHPTVPLDRIIANINVDMIGRNAPDSIVVIGKDYSSLGEVVDQVGARHPELGLAAADDIWPEERFFFRSDHFNFARKEIPAIFFFAGVHECYHRPCDEVEEIDTDKAARVARFIFYTAHDIADADDRPVWDPEGLEEVRALTR